MRIVWNVNNYLGFTLDFGNSHKCTTDSLQPKNRSEKMFKINIIIILPFSLTEFNFVKDLCNIFKVVSFDCIKWKKGVSNVFQNIL